MDIEKLWDILYKERSSTTLQELPKNFYSELRKYIQYLEEERRKERNERNRRLIEDEIRSARGKIEDVFRRRIGKIVRIASTGMKTYPKGITHEEKKIFDDVNRCVEEGRKRIMELIFPEEK